METIDNNFEQTSSSHESNSNLSINQDAIFHLQGTAKWAGFFAIINLAFIALIIVTMLGMLFIGTLSALFIEQGISIPVLAAICFFYLILLIILSLPIWWLYKFSVNTKQAIESRDTIKIAYAFSLIKRYFKFYGILIIIILSFYALIFLGGLLFGLFSAL